MILNPLTVALEFNSFKDKDSGGTINTIGYRLQWGADKPKGKFAMRKALETSGKDLVMILAELGAELVRDLDRCGYLRAMADPPEESKSALIKQLSQEEPSVSQ